MADVTCKRFDDMESIVGGGYIRARSELGVSSFGMQVISLPANGEGFEHSHQGLPFETENGQEEVYVPLEGKATLFADGERFELEPGLAVRLGPSVVRKLVAGDQPFRMLALGGVPGSVYAPSDFSNVGAASPFE